MNFVMRMIASELGVEIPIELPLSEPTPDVTEIFNQNSEFSSSIGVEETPQTCVYEETGEEVIVTIEVENPQKTNSSNIGATKKMLERYIYKCPPGGENLVIIYTTTNPQALAKVLESSEYVLQEIKSHGIEIFERDCYLNTNYKLELENLVGELSILPRVFVRGRYIGGELDIKRIAIDNELGTLLHGIHKYTPPIPRSLRVQETPQTFEVAEEKGFVTCEVEEKEITNSSDRAATEKMLKSYTYMCPPGGENLVIIYTTTDPCVKAKVLKKCEYVRRTLESYGIKIFERDCYLNADYMLEMKNMFWRTNKVPRVFVKGRYIGGHFIFKLIHKGGDMKILLHGIP